jgi:hypothetical protein
VATTETISMWARRALMVLGLPIVFIIPLIDVVLFGGRIGGIRADLPTCVETAGRAWARVW